MEHHIHQTVEEKYQYHRNVGYRQIIDLPTAEANLDTDI